MAEDEVDLSDLSDIEVRFDSLIFIRLITNMWRGTMGGGGGRTWENMGWEGHGRREGRKGIPKAMGTRRK